MRLPQGVLRQGVVAGLIAAGVVALWFLIFDLIAREPFYTPATLGSVFFFGARSPAEVQFAFLPIFVYTLFHLAAFIVLGLIGAAFFIGAERERTLIIGFALVLVTHIPLFVGLLRLLGEWVLESIGFWQVVIGAILGAATLVFLLSKAHPGIVGSLGNPNLEDPH